jgi:hypothetical protein
LNSGIRLNCILSLILAAAVVGLTACSSGSQPQAPTSAEPAAAQQPAVSTVPPRIVKLFPTETPPGVGFNIQPDGKAAIAIKCEHATSKTTVMWDGQPLVTAIGNPEAVSALVPAALYAKSGEHVIFLQAEAGKSNEVVFFVRAPLPQ